jgi:flagellin
MTISSILNNLAAINAQSSIGNATQAVQNDTTALSSGNRLVNASTDVAALSTGTALQSQVNSLTTALTISAQGSSLLQVADGALAQIQSIIERQQAIASSAQSGSLSDVQRGFLDQEFQNLSSQIDQL